MMALQYFSPAVRLHTISAPPHHKYFLLDFDFFSRFQTTSPIFVLEKVDPVKILPHDVMMFFCIGKSLLSFG